MSGFTVHSTAGPPPAALAELSAPAPHFLADRIDEIERSLNDGSWIRTDFSESDRAMMPHLVAMANDRKAGLALCYLPVPGNLCDALDAFWRDGRGSQRYIVNAGKTVTHFVALDVAAIGGKVSVLLFEPVTFESEIPDLLAVSVRNAVTRTGLPYARVAAIELDIQRSDAECGMFSLALAKKLHKERDCILAFHRANLAEKVGERVSAGEADRFLSPAFFKHAQGTTRLVSYLDRSPMGRRRAVNKKGQTLSERQWGALEDVQGRMFCKSIHLKRLVEYRALAKHWGGTAEVDSPRRENTSDQGGSARRRPSDSAV